MVVEQPLLGITAICILFGVVGGMSKDAFFSIVAVSTYLSYLGHSTNWDIILGFWTFIVYLSSFATATLFIQILTGSGEQ